MATDEQKKIAEDARVLAQAATELYRRADANGMRIQFSLIDERDENVCDNREEYSIDRCLVSCWIPAYSVPGEILDGIIRTELTDIEKLGRMEDRK